MSNQKSGKKDPRFTGGFTPQQVKAAGASKWGLVNKQAEEEKYEGLSQIERLKLASKES